jgi:hypothetical protein
MENILKKKQSKILRLNIGAPGDNIFQTPGIPIMPRSGRLRVQFYTTFDEYGF